MGDLLQFLVKTPVTPRAKFYSGGVLTNLDGPAGGTCTVTLTRPDGTAGPASGAVTNVSTGIYSFDLDGPTDPIVFDIAWAGAIGGKAVTQDTQAEALGELLFTLPDLRALKVAGDARFASGATWPDEQLMDARTAVLDEVAQILGFSPVPRFRRQIFDGDGSPCLDLPGLKATRPLSVTLGGVAQTVSNYQVGKGNQLVSVSNFSYGTPFTWGWRNVVIEWIHGWERPEGMATTIAMLMAAKHLDPSGFTSAQSVVTPDGLSYTYEPAEMGRSGFTRHTGVKDLDRWLHRWSQAGSLVV